jgi:hypothetical protein
MHRSLTLFGGLGFAAAVALATIPLAGQAQLSKEELEAKKAEERKLIIAVAEGQKKRAAALTVTSADKNWKPERTPWGDPDISGPYTNSDESNIPFERPAEFEGKTFEGRQQRRARQAAGPAAQTPSSTAPRAPSRIRTATRSCSGGRTSTPPAAARGSSTIRRTARSRR